MAQHDYVLDNQAGSAFRSDTNSALAAVVSQNSGASAPATTFAYQPWADTTTGVLKVRNAANNAWVNVYDLTTGKPIGFNTLLTGVSGTNAITASTHASVAAYTTGDTYRFIAANTNTTAVTINITGASALGVKDIRDMHGVALVAGNIVAGQLVTATYGGTYFRLVSVGNVLDTGDIGVSVQGYDVDTAKLDVVQTFTTSQRGTVTTDNDLSFALGTTNNFKCTPTAGAALTFTGLASGQSGFIWLDNSGGHAITAAAGTIVDSNLLSTISTAGVYILSYFCDGSNVAVVSSGAVA